ncbi:MAG: hypothetical protein ACRC6S_12235 [Shewanella sp.]
MSSMTSKKQRESSHTPMGFSDIVVHKIGNSHYPNESGWVFKRCTQFMQTLWWFSGQDGTSMLKTTKGG